MTQYHFVTVWKFEAPIEKIWALLQHAEQWPTWWKGVIKVETLKPGDENGVGTVHRLTWRSQLPYNLIFESKVVRVMPYSEIAGEATGELAGTGVWHLSQEGSITRVQYNWDVSTTKAWMNALAPIARPFFAWNHNVVMHWGGEGMAKLLGTPLMEEKHD